MGSGSSEGGGGLDKLGSPGQGRFKTGGGVCERRGGQLLPAVATVKNKSLSNTKSTFLYVFYHRNLLNVCWTCSLTSRSPLAAFFYFLFP